MKLSLKLTCMALASTMSACAPADVPNDDVGAWGTVALVEDLRIGLSSGAPEYLFGSIDSIVQHPDGTVFVADRQVPVIRRYEATGAYLHDLGRFGHGPGEYADVRGMQLLPDGNLAIWDPRTQRVTVFAPDGAWVKDFKAERAVLGDQPMFWVDQEGNSYVLTYRRNEDAPTEYPTPVLSRYSPEGEQAGFIEAPIDQPETPILLLRSRQGYALNFTRRHAFTLARSGYLVTGHTDDYQFEIRDDDRLVAAVHQPWEPVLLHPEEQEAWSGRQERVTQYRRENPSQAYNSAPPVAFAPVPDVKPAYMDFWAGDDGTIWVRRYAEAHRRNDLPPQGSDEPFPPFAWWQYPTFDAFGSEGEFLGTIELPHDVRAITFHSDYVWTVQGSATDEDVAVRYRIDRAGS